VRILVTGGTGFIGRHLIAELRKRHEIVALTRSEPPEDVLDGVDWREQDLRDPLRGFPDRVDGIVHLAQSPRYKEFPDGAEDVYAVNVQSTFRLLEWARTASASSFILVSTGGLYPFSDEPVSEDGPSGREGSTFVPSTRPRSCSAPMPSIFAPSCCDRSSSTAKVSAAC